MGSTSSARTTPASRIAGRGDPHQDRTLRVAKAHKPRRTTRLPLACNTFVLSVGQGLRPGLRIYLESALLCGHAGRPLALCESDATRERGGSPWRRLRLLRGVPHFAYPANLLRGYEVHPHRPLPRGRTQSRRRLREVW